MGAYYIGPIILLIIALLVILCISYRQTISAYPVDGGAYTVAKENMGKWAGLVAATALAIDYVLNVAVAISAGVAALVSAVQQQWLKEVESSAHKAGVRPPRLIVVEPPYRRFAAPVIEQLDHLKAEFPDRQIAIVIPELVEKHWWGWLLHTGKILRLRYALAKRGEHRVVIINVPWYIEQ